MREWTFVILCSITLGALLYSVKSIYATVALIIPPTYVAIRESQQSRIQKKIEENLPRALLELATLPTHTLRDVINHLSRGYGELSDEFRRANRLVATGIPPEKAMREVAARSGSYLLMNAVSIIITGVHSGSRWSELIRSTAEDIEALIDMERERSSALALQRYVVLLSAGVFVPAVLGITKRMTDRLIGNGPFTVADLLISIQNATLFHILSLSLMASLFVALLEGKPRKAIVYVAILIPLTMGTYLLSAGIGI